MMTSQATAPADRRATASLSSGGWLTAVLRPAGTLDGASAAAFGRLLDDLSATADMIVVDLDAARIPDLAAFVETLWPAATCLADPGKCLLLANAPMALEHAVSVAGVPAATFRDAVPIPAHPHEGGPTFGRTPQANAWLSPACSIADPAPTDQAATTSSARQNG